jgi:tetratricopeptide (TPR) repeat protein
VERLAMGGEELKEQALRHFQRAYELQMNGELDEAILHYTKSIELYPTAEAYTFRGWTYSFQGRYDEAIEECHRAIAIDPEFGNPYNDIGCYLMAKGLDEEAIPWLERAKRARRYANPEFPYLNAGRIWERRGEWQKALAEFRQAFALRPADPDLAKTLQTLLSRGNGKRFADPPKTNGES